MEKKKKKWRLNKNFLPGLAMVGPTGLWMIAFMLLPLIYVIAISFMTKGLFGGVVWTPTLKNYQDIINPVYGKVCLKSLKIALLTTLFSLLVSYPFAYALSKVKKRWKSICMLLIMVPFWINGLLRLNGWVTIFRETGPLNTLLTKLGLPALNFMYTETAIVFGMVYTFMPFMVLPIHTSISKLDSTLLEAASDLGATKLHTFLRVILPLTFPGIFAGSIQVFIPSLGAFFISDIMGGGNTMLLGNLIKNQYLNARNWPSGAAFSVLLIVFTLVVMQIYTRLGGDMDEMV
ncbi:MAG: ABC transporter permease [Lachnospiraceae bacterium]|nr:ABC transporter permease [Lachnospiraceae bacterium]HCJ09189.1 spermidine/putrescine ABC transporter permease [Lachnospiraceae bacterium]